MKGTEESGDNYHHTQPFHPLIEWNIFQDEVTKEVFKKKKLFKKMQSKS